jgi:pimeloyl-ACP methyl ester carboxylesterase
MKRPVRIAVKALTIYVALSLVVAIVMAELTLHPMRLPLPDRARIAAMYAPYGSDLQPVVIQAVDGVELHAWYSVPKHQNGQAVILLHGIGDNRGGVAGYGQAFLREGYRILLPDSRAHGEAPWRPTACAKATTLAAGFPGSKVEVQAVSTALENRWAPRWCWRAYLPIPGFARLLPILRSQLSAMWPTIGKGISWELGASAWSELSEERSDCSLPSWVFSTPAGATV